MKSLERDDVWLENRLELVWARYFSDVVRITPVRIHFGRASYRRLGSIALRKSGLADEGRMESRILISSILKSPQVPTLVIDQIIAHELVHYVHGFGSEHRRVLKHPHQGGVILTEFQRRGVWELYRAYQAWMKAHWEVFVKDYMRSANKYI